MDSCKLLASLPFLVFFMDLSVSSIVETFYLSDWTDCKTLRVPFYTRIRIIWQGVNLRSPVKDSNHCDVRFRTPVNSGEFRHYYKACFKMVELHLPCGQKIEYYNSISSGPSKTYHCRAPKRPKKWCSKTLAFDMTAFRLSTTNYDVSSRQYNMTLDVFFTYDHLNIFTTSASTSQNGYGNDVNGDGTSEGEDDTTTRDVGIGASVIITLIISFCCTCCKIYARHNKSCDDRSLSSDLPNEGEEIPLHGEAIPMPWPYPFATTGEPMSPTESQAGEKVNRNEESRKGNCQSLGNTLEDHTTKDPLICVRCPAESSNKIAGTSHQQDPVDQADDMSEADCTCETLTQPPNQEHCAQDSLRPPPPKYSDMFPDNTG